MTKQLLSYHLNFFISSLYETFLSSTILFIPFLSDFLSGFCAMLFYIGYLEDVGFNHLLKVIIPALHAKIIFFLWIRDSLPLIFQCLFDRFWTPRWDPKKLPKSVKNPSWPPQGPPGTPEAAQKPPGSHFEASRKPFWSHFGTIVGIILVICWDTFRPKLPASPAAPATIAAQVFWVGGCPR